MLVGIILGVVAAIMRLSPNPIVSGASWLYIWFFRGTPLLVQILFWYNLQALFPTISLGIPFGPAFVHTHANSIITTLVAGLLALGLNEGAYMSEIVRAGIISVDEGQTQAAQSLGMSRLQIMRLIVLPQAMRVIIPPTGNETISMLKNTSLLSVISFGELLFAAQTIYDVNYKIIALLIVASIWYLAMTSVLYVGQYFIERRYGRGFSRAERATMRERWLAARRRAAPMTDSMVRAEGVHKRFGRLEVLKGIDLEVKPGEVMCMLGPSGSGKSTFLRCINHLEKINAGRLYVDGELVGYRQSGDKLYELREDEVAHKRAEIGMVFQQFNLFPHMTALENVALAPIRVKGMSARAMREAGASSCFSASGSATSWAPTRWRCRVGSSSGWRSPARSPWSRS